MGLKSKPLSEVRLDVPVQDVIKDDVVRVNFNVPDAMRQRWKIAAVNERRPMSDLLIDAMNTYLDTHKH